MGHYRLADGCGIARGLKKNEFYLSNGGGEIYKLAMKDREVFSQKLLLKSGEYQWDNHMLSVI